jgi:transcriptional regulator with XRE-family HTH domain
VAGLGERIRRLRLARDLTLKQVGERAGVSPTHLSEIERDKTSPTIGALCRIARALGEEPSRLVDTDPVPAVSASYDPGRRIRLDNGVAVRSISGDPGEITVVELDLPANEQAPRQNERGEEFLLVLEGAVELELSGKRYLLNEGDAIHYGAAAPHVFRNPGVGRARVLWVTSPPAVW